MWSVIEGRIYVKNFKDSTKGNTVFRFERDGTKWGGN
jgi:hypothetical protein